jgi:hypothetical protein
MKPVTRLLACALAILLAAGCSTQIGWVYEANSYPAPKEAGTALAVVLPFEDRRENINEDRSAIALIPLVPYGRVIYHVPPGMELFIKPTEYFAKALADDLRASRRYKDAYFDSKVGDANFIFKGEILNTDFISEIYTYGLSAFCGFPWLLGLPVGKVTNDLSLKLACTDKSGDILFEKTYSADPYEKVIWLYYAQPNMNYPNMTREIYGEFLRDLATSGKCV